jgi:hypothetical protein
MPYSEVPSDTTVVQALVRLGGHATALELCEELVRAKFPRRDSQLAIQRSAERGRINVAADWTLSVAQEVAAA